MPSVLTRLASLFPGYRPAPTPDARAEAVIKDTKAALDASTRRGRPASEEKIPKLYHGGVAGTVWFLPYRDSATKDTADIRAAMRLMRRDGYVKAAWEPQILAIEGEDSQVQPAEAGNPESEAQAKFVKTALEDYVSGGLRSIIRAICAPLGSDGFSIAEKVWGYAARGRLAGKFVCTAVKAKDPEDGLRVEGDKFGNVTGVTSLRNPGEHFPISDFLYSRYLHVFDEPLGEAAFRAAYGAYWMRDTVRKLRVIHHEKKMAGMLMGTYQDDADKAGLEVALRAAKTATWISVPEGVKVEAIALSTANETDYKSFDESLRDEIVTAIAFATLQMLLGNAPGGVRGDSEVQKQTSDLGPWLLMTIVTEVVNTQLIPDLIDFNFPYAAGGYPKLSFGAVSADAILKEQQVVTGAMAAGMKPSKKHYAKTWGIQLADPDDPDDQLQAATTAPSPGAPPAPLPFAERGPGPTRACFSEPPADEVALAGKDGRRAATLLGNAKREGVAVLSRLTEAAVGRLLAAGTALTSPVLFTDDELRELSESFAATVAAADLLGRSRVRRWAEMTEKGTTFSEADDPFTVFDDAAPGGVPFLAPQAALDYFRGLVPTLGNDPQRYGPLLQRHAFTLAHATDQTLLEKVKAAILAKLSGETAAPGNVAVEDILDAAGVSPRNPQYGEMAYRTNMMDAYNAGASAELQAPEMREAFPAWRYEGIEDGREGEDHRPHFGRLYPSTAAFADVRGPRVWNCRCSATPVSKWELAELQKRGTRVESVW